MSDQDPKETIIVAEDSVPNRKILTHLLEKLGFQVIACENGQLAWDALNSAETGPVSLVISDIMMPTMDGLQLLRQIRDHEKLKPMPVILITAVSEKEYIVKARELNVSGYILKPITFQRVQEKMQELFPQKKFAKLSA